MSEMVRRIADAMKTRASQPLGNLTSLEPVLVGSLGDAWDDIARAAIQAMREPTVEMECVEVKLPGYGDYDCIPNGHIWRAMIDKALE